MKSRLVVAVRAHASLELAFVYFQEGVFIMGIHHKFQIWALVAANTLFAWGCKSNGPAVMVQDGAMDGAGDAAIEVDGPIDAPTTTAYTGTIAIEDVALFQGSDDASIHGGKISISLGPKSTGVAPYAGPYGADGSTVDPSLPDALVPCYGIIYDVSNNNVANQFPPFSDEGVLDFTVTKAAGNTGGTAKTVPECAYEANAAAPWQSQYVCPGNTGTDGAIAPTTNGSGMTATLDFKSTGKTFAASNAGDYLMFSSGALAGTAFPVVGVGTSATANDTLLIGDPCTAGAGCPLTVPATGPWVLVTGAGPVPWSASNTTTGAPTGGGPSFFYDTDAVSVGLTAGADAHFASFTSQTLQVPDQPLLTTTTKGLLAGNLNMDGSTDAVFGCNDVAVAATGTITLVARASLHNNDNFTLNDGIHPPKVFEYRVDATFVGTLGSTTIDVTAATDAASVANATKLAINGASSSLGITAGTVGNTVTLKANLKGPAYNTPNSENVASTNDGIAITNMTGGVAGCPSDQSGMVVIIDTTDGSTTGVASTTLPLASKYQGRIVCTSLGNSVTIDHRMMNTIASASTVTRKQITVLSTSFQPGLGADPRGNKITFVAGKGWVAVTNGPN